MSRVLLGSLLTVALGAGTAPALAASSDATAQQPRVQVALALSGDASQALAFAARHGLHVDSRTRRTLVLSGPAGSTAAAFGTRLNAVHAQDPRERRSYLAPASTPPVPAELRGSVSALVGFDTRPLFRQHAVPRGYTGRELAAAYDTSFDPTATAGGGAGLTIATVQFDGWDSGDASTYAAAAGVPLAAGQISTVSVGGAVTTGTNVEAALDVEALLATAPRARQRVYVAPNSSAGAYAVYDQIASDVAAGLVQVVSTSWGGCEPDISSSNISAIDSRLQRIIAGGGTMFAASGDSGAYDCAVPSAPDGRLAVDFPASSPSVIGVGGTTLTGSGTSWSETAWGAAPTTTAASSYPGDGSGGGISSIFARPAWQSAGSSRQVPDVAALGDAAVGFGAYAGGAGGWRVFGGTSLAAPVWAGQLATAMSAAGRTTGLGDLHPLLYAHPDALRDVTSGSNSYYTASAGYDSVTGLGSPQWSRLSPVLGLAGTGSAVVPGPTVTRLSGNDRYETAAAVFSARFSCTQGGVGSALLARGDGFADALSGSYLAGSEHTGVLLTGTTSLPAATLTALRNSGASTVYLLGGPSAVSDAVQSTLAATPSYSCSGAAGPALHVVRLAGDNRYATARLIAEQPGASAVGSAAPSGSGPVQRTAVVAGGLVAADALAAGPLSYAGGSGQGFPTLLTDPRALAPEAAAALKELGIQQVIVPGGTASVSDAVVQQIQSTGLLVIRLAGTDRTATAAAIAAFATGQNASYPAGLGFSKTELGLARGDGYADALAAAAFAGARRMPLLLTTSSTALGTPTTSALRGMRGSVVDLTAFGGLGALSAAVLDSAAGTLGG